MGRDTVASKTPLLNDAEQNIGNGVIIQPQAGLATCIPQTNPSRVIKLSGGSAAGQTTSVVITASRIVGASNPYPGLAGPITGVIEFGNGSQSTKAEFDVPVGPFTGSIDVASNAVEPQDGGVIVTVPTGVVRAYTRYDNLLISPVLNYSPAQSIAQIAGVPFFGPGGPITYGGGTIIPAEPIQTKAMASYFSRPHALVYKTLYCYIGGASNTTVELGINTQQLISPYYFCLPAFTKSVKVLRLPLSAAIDVTISN